MASCNGGEMTAKQTGLDVSDLTVAYRQSGGSIVACQDVNFEADLGQFVAIVGSSGCGKTTVLNTIAGFIKPVSGSVRIGGRPVVRPNASCTVVFQSYALFPWMTVEGNLYFGLRMKGASWDEARSRIDEYLAMMGLAGANKLYPYQLSGGMQQRVALARALVISPATVLMDEPFAAVDLQTRETLQNELATIRAATSQTIVLVTHSVDEAVYLSDKVVVMGGRPGRVISTYHVPLQHPRAPGIRSAKDFLEIRDEISLRLRTISEQK